MEDVNAVQSVHIKVAEGIKGCGTKVEDIIVNTLVDVEVNRRVSLIQIGMTKLNTLKNDLKKTDKPDNTSHVPDGQGGFTIQSSYTDKLFNELKAKREGIVKLETTLNSALGTNSADAYGNLEKLVK